MNEWAVVGVIITLVTFFIAISKPLIELTKAITKLTAAVGTLQDRADKHEEKSHESHCKLWDYNTAQDEKIAANTAKIIEHDGKIILLEKTIGGHKS